MNRSLFWLFAIVCSFLFTQNVSGQEVPILHFTQDDGLPANTIYFLYRDSNDFLWISTDKGIARYNGIKFEKFSTFDGMPDNEIFFFREDFDGRLWLATFNGELCYYKNGIFHTAANTPFLKMPFKTAFIKDISVQYDSSVNIIFADASILLNIKNEHVSIVHLKEVLKDEHQNRVIFNEKIGAEKYRLITSNAVLVVDNTNNNPHIVKREPVGRGNEMCAGKWELSFSQNQSYIFNKCSIFDKDLKEIGTIPQELVKDDFVYQIYFNKQGKFLTTSKGLIYNDYLTLLKTEKISTITQDKSGNYWVGTLENGLYSINKSFLTSSVVNKAYKGKLRYASVVKGRLFFVDEENNVLGLSGNNVTNLLERGRYLKEKNSVSNAYFIDSSLNYYYCSNSSCAAVDNLQNPNKVLQYRIELKGPNSLKKAILLNNELFLHASFRIVKIDVNGQQAYKVLNDTTKSERIYGMAQDRDNNIWYTTVNNVYKAVDDHSTVQNQFGGITFKTFDFFGKDLIGYTHDNQLVICSNIDGKVQIDSVRGQNCIWDKLYRIDANHILLSTNNLYRVLTLSDGKKPQFSISTIENPFIPTQAETICIDSPKSYFFKNGKITAIDIKTLLESPVPPKPYFTFLQTRKATYPITPNVKISFRESRNMKISFITASFSGKELSYQYSLSRTDADNWVDVLGDEINIINSGYGNYIIKVRAKTVSSEYSEPVVFRLDVMRPYWATWWFFLLCACAMAVLIFMVVRKRVEATLNKRQREHENQVRFMKSEYKALNALMNPHFIFNTLNNVQGLVNRNDKRAANEYLRVFADLVRQNMHNVSKELITLQKELDLVANYLKLEKLRFKDMLNYSIDIQDDIDLSEIMIPPLLVQPLVENSIKHGILPLESIEGQIMINIYRRDNVLYLEVKDNGIGVIESQKKPRTSHESFGLENIRKRIEQLGIIQNKEFEFHIGEMYSDEGTREWTVATITMPIEDEIAV